ncbi:MAG: YgjV family protein [Clostridia bacterium]|nr:YgjV family protein [Clostridia bacterium]
MEITAQIIGIIGSALTIISYQCKNPRKLIMLQGAGGLMFAINFFMLGAYTGALLNLVNVVRSISFAKIKSKNKLLPITLIAVYAISTVFTYNGWLSIAVFAAQTAGTVIFYLDNDKIIKIVSLCFVSPVWFVHNALTGSLGGVMCEGFAMVSIIVYIARTKGFRKSEA